MAKTVLKTNNISIVFGGLHAVEDFSIEIKEGYMDALSSGTLILELSKDDGEKIKDVSIKEIIVK